MSATGPVAATQRMHADLQEILQAAPGADSRRLRGASLRELYSECFAILDDMESQKDDPAALQEILAYTRAGLLERFASFVKDFKDLGAGQEELFREDETNYPTWYRAVIMLGAAVKCIECFLPNRKLKSSLGQLYQGSQALIDAVTANPIWLTARANGVMLKKYDEIRIDVALLIADLVWGRIKQSPDPEEMLKISRAALGFFFPIRKILLGRFASGASSRYLRSTTALSNCIIRNCLTEVHRIQSKKVKRGEPIPTFNVAGVSKVSYEEIFAQCSASKAVHWDDGMGPEDVLRFEYQILVQIIQVDDSRGLVEAASRTKFLTESHHLANKIWDLGVYEPRHFECHSDPNMRIPYYAWFRSIVASWSQLLSRSEAVKDEAIATALAQEDSMVIFFLEKFASRPFPFGDDDKRMPSKAPVVGSIVSSINNTLSADNPARLVFIERCRLISTRLRARPGVPQGLINAFPGVGDASSPCCRHGCADMDIAKKQCGGCRSIKYCSEKCQKLDWREHKEHCIPMTATKT
ncbi:hypothetical protein DL93DRAFT_2086301 [Clavulina sp. PMI_390]|nr:hypothetical protein DL93DRAFT_2086301 [Clavulina sp. PMI_390]